MSAASGPESPVQWISERLASPHDNIVTSWVPAGFDAYARVLHEVEGYDEVTPVVRWGDVANWSGASLGADTQWIDVALPEVAPPGPPPWHGQGPRDGCLSKADTLALADVLDPSAHAQCFFGVWSGYGPLIDVHRRVEGESAPVRSTSQPSVELPWRDYQIYVGESSGAASFIIPGPRYQSPNIWWAADRSWFVATEIDLRVTYVGGSRDVINRLLLDPRLETTPSEADSSITRQFSPWLVDVADAAYREVLATGTAEIRLSLGTVHVTLEKSRLRRAHLATRSQQNSGGGSASGTGRMSTKDPEVAESIMRLHIERAIASLVS